MKLSLSNEWYRAHLNDPDEPGGLMACSPEIYDFFLTSKEKSMPNMRAKMYVQHIAKYPAEGEATQETLSLSAVAASKYPEDGSDEDNTYAKFSPSASLVITVCNPALLGKFAVGEKYYVDFTPAQ